MDDRTLAERVANTPSPPALAPLLDEVKHTLEFLEKTINEWAPSPERTYLLNVIRDGVKE